MNPITRAEACIKQLCCLGLPSEMIIPAVLKELHTLVPGCGRTFFWCDDDYQLSNLYDDPLGVPEVVGLYMQEFYGRPERELHLGFTYWMRHYHGVIEFSRILRVDRKTFLNSDFYNLILRAPPAYTDGLHLIMRAGGRALGALAVWRGLNDVKFTAKEKRRLQGLEPFIAHAIEANRKTGASQASLIDEDEHGGLLIVDRMGRIQHISPQARRLLFLASNPQVTPSTTPGEAVRLPPEIIQVCRNLVAIFQSKQDVVSPPVYVHHNPWGVFVFRAYWLDNDNPFDSLIGITIQHQIPLPIKIIGQLEQFPLSRQQMQICTLLASGYSDAAIAQRLHMSINTVLTHNRRIYNKLNVHSRAELVTKLTRGGLQ